jgi:hypothetical protein
MREGHDDQSIIREYTPFIGRRDEPETVVRTRH